MCVGASATHTSVSQAASLSDDTIADKLGVAVDAWRRQSMSKSHKGCFGV